MVRQPVRPLKDPQSRPSIHYLAAASVLLSSIADDLGISLAARVSNRRESFYTLDYLARTKERERRTVENSAETT